MTSFVGDENLDYSAASRVELWGACFKAMVQHPILGLGPDHWPLHAESFGFTPGKEAHSTWMQLGADLGFIGLALILCFYLGCILRLLPLASERSEVSDPWLRYLARAIVASLAGFLVAAQFVSVEGIELPYYLALVGAGVLRLSPMSPRQSGQPHFLDLPETGPVCVARPIS